MQVRDYKLEIGKLADFLLKNNFRPRLDEGAVDVAIRVIRENTTDRNNIIYGKRFEKRD